MNLHLGTDRNTKRPVAIPLPGAARQHMHLVGYTGTGKTTALIHTLAGLMPLATCKKCIFVIDRLGGFSMDLFAWFASHYCPTWVRERLIYVESGARGSRGANEIPFCTTRPAKATTARPARRKSSCAAGQSGPCPNAAPGPLDVQRALCGGAYRL